MKPGKILYCVSSLLSLAVAQPALAGGCRVGMLLDMPVTMHGLRASVPVKVNNQETDFWLDTGAFFSIMPAAKASELGLPLSPAPAGFYLIGVGGTASAQIATVKSFGLVGQNIPNVQFLVGGTDTGNGVIGRNILGIADTEFDLAHGSVKLMMPHDCGKVSLAYWAPGKPYFEVPLINGPNPHDHIFRIAVTINGTKIEADMDSGAPTSLISRKAVERAGINLSGPGVTPLNHIGGLGRHVANGWMVPVDDVGIGDEHILKARLSVIDGPIARSENAPDMLLGADFMLAHHIYVARRQNLMYFTYSGGKPFLSDPSADTPPDLNAPVALPPGTTRVTALDTPDAEPKTAAEFARRGTALLAQRAFAGAIADLTKAIAMEPRNSEYYSDRARAYGQTGQTDKARADLEQALQLDPDNGELLRIRAFMRLAAHDKAGALADAEASVKTTKSASLDAASLAFLFETLGQPQRAVSILDGVIALHRDDARLGVLLNGRCWARALANVELDKALADCDKAIKRDGAKAAYLDSRGLVYFRSGDTAKALADYKAALALDPRLPWSLYVRGLAESKQGDAQAAKADKTAALALDPQIAKKAAGYGIGT